MVVFMSNEMSVGMMSVPESVVGASHVWGGPRGGLGQYKFGGGAWGELGGWMRSSGEVGGR